MKNDEYEFLQFVERLNISVSLVRDLDNFKSVFGSFKRHKEGYTTPKAIFIEQQYLFDVPDEYYSEKYQQTKKQNLLRVIERAERRGIPIFRTCNLVDSLYRESETKDKKQRKEKSSSFILVGGAHFNFDGVNNGCVITKGCVSTLAEKLFQYISLSGKNPEIIIDPRITLIEGDLHEDCLYIVKGIVERGKVICEKEPLRSYLT